MQKKKRNLKDQQKNPKNNNFHYPQLSTVFHFSTFPFCFSPLFIFILCRSQVKGLAPFNGHKGREEQRFGGKFIGNSQHFLNIFFICLLCMNCKQLWTRAAGGWHDVKFCSCNSNRKNSIVCQMFAKEVVAWRRRWRRRSNNNQKTKANCEY